mmetsp:Transcript_426/g.877  ORF Transcript_426/g.877 Transcript_426/m.877 type:complete len:215 (-) Transcript_426:128-772(-)
MLEELGDCRPPARIPLQAPLKHIQQSLLHFLGMVLESMPPGELHRHVRVSQGKQPLHWVQVGKGCLHVDHLVQDDTQGPDVRRSAHLHRPLLHGLRCHVADGAHRRLSADVGGVAGNPLCDPEVNQLQALFDQQEVPRLQIGMHNPLAVDDLNCLQHLLPECLDISEGHVCFHLQEPSQVHLPFLHDNVDQKPLGQNLRIKNLNDVLAVLQLLK